MGSLDTHLVRIEQFQVVSTNTMGDRGASYAYFFSRNELIGKYLTNAIDTIGKYPENLDHLGLGKAMAQQMRYTPLYFICSQSMYKSDFLLADRISIVSDEISEDFTDASLFANKFHIKNF